jgi:hypothetical protein
LASMMSDLAVEAIDRNRAPAIIRRFPNGFGPQGAEGSYSP